MARIRTIKPEFWTSEQIADVSRDARLLFIGLLNFCDDAGRHPASIRRLKMQVLPADDCTVEQMNGWIDELLDVGLLDGYGVAGKSYWQVTGWHHQRIDQPTYRYPAANGVVLCSPNKRRTAGERSMREGSRQESERNGSGKEGDDEDDDDQIDITSIEESDSLFERVARTIPVGSTQDIELLRKVCYLVVAGKLSEHALRDSVNAIRNATEPIDSEIKYLQACLWEHVGGKKKFHGLLASVKLNRQPIERSERHRERPRSPPGCSKRRAGGRCSTR